MMLHEGSTQRAAAGRSPHTASWVFGGGRLRIAASVPLLLVLLVAAGCSRAPPREVVDTALPETLTALRLYEGRLSDLVPAANVTRYEINSASFCDHAASDFVLKLPAGQAAAYRSEGSLEFPVGTVLAQTLSYDVAGASEPRRVETRVLMRRADKWVGLPYVWNEAQTDAQLELVGARIPITRQLPDGSTQDQLHVVPNFNDCKRCHRIADEVTPLGTSARQLNCDFPATTADGGQLQAWARRGLLSRLPPAAEVPRLARWDDAAGATIDQRARAWLEANCAHCHNPQGTARNSGLQLGAAVRDPTAFGVLKAPVAAGRGSANLIYDITPGQPDASILLRRVRSTEPGIMMPEFGRTQVDEQGVALLREWIASMSTTAYAALLADRVGLVESLTPEQLSEWARDVRERGDATRGAAVLARQELNCIKCHSVRGQGANVGPDLAKLGPQATAEHIVESILLPAKVIKQGFEAVVVETDGGLVVTGVLVIEDPSQVVLRDPVRGETAISKRQITDRATAGSLMPANVASLLRREELLDLARYLLELNAPPAGAAPPAAP